MRETLKDILMRRDGICDELAQDMINECREQILEACARKAGICEVDSIIASELGLEPDYLEEILGGC